MKTKAFKDKVLSLSDRIFPMVSRFLGNQSSAEDAVQEIMIKLWQKRTKIESHPNLAGFVFLTAKNYCLDILRKKSPSLIYTEDVMEKHEGPKLHNELEWEELKSIVEKILQQLPDQQREVMSMRDLDGMEFSEIAEVTNLKVEHIRVLLSRARKQVPAGLNKIENYEHK